MVGPSRRSYKNPCASRAAARSSAAKRRAPVPPGVCRPKILAPDCGPNTIGISRSRYGGRPQDRDKTWFPVPFRRRSSAALHGFEYRRGAAGITIDADAEIEFPPHVHPRDKDQSRASSASESCSLSAPKSPCDAGDRSCRMTTSPGPVLRRGSTPAVGPSDPTLTPDSAASMRSCGLPVVQGEPTIDKDILDSGCELLGLLEGCMILDGCRIEYDHVGEIARLEQSSFLQRQVRGWQARQTMDASARVTCFSSRTYFARTLAKVPYALGC